MPRRRIPSTLLLAVLSLAVAGPAAAYRRLKLGPLEVVPALTVEVKQHSNIYVTSEGRQQAEAMQVAELQQQVADPSTSPRDREIAQARLDSLRDNSIVERSGLLLDIRPGLNFVVRPQLERRVRGLFLDLRYTPTLILYPDAPEVEFFAPDGRTVERREDPDSFKLDHTAQGTLRYQFSPTLTASLAASYTHPELAQGNLRLDDLRTTAGVKYDVTRTMSAEGNATWQRFETPVRRLTNLGNGVVVDREEKLALGTFDGWIYQGLYNWQLTSTLGVGAVYTHTRREFPELESDATRAVGMIVDPSSPSTIPCLPNDPANPNCVPINDVNEDTVPDNLKNYRQHTIEGRATQRLSRTSRGTFRAGYSWRELDERQFGDERYSSFVGSATVDTLLAQRTRLQASAEYTLADTVREITFEDLNALTNDQIGQFAILPEPFSVAFNQRYLVDLIQNVFKRGDQILLGVGYQRDRLEDQLSGGQNFLDPRTGQPRSDIDRQACQARPESCLFRPTVTNNARQRLFLVSAGYRRRVLSYLGVQVRGTYYDAERQPELSDRARELLGADAPTLEPDRTSYWSLSGGLVLNLQVLQ